MVEREKIITGKNVQIGDIILGLASNGLHTNGYSLARKLCIRGRWLHWWIFCK